MNIITLLELEALVWLLAHTPEITCEQLGIDRDGLAEKLTDEHLRGRLAREIKSERASRNAKARAGEGR